LAFSVSLGDNIAKQLKVMKLITLFAIVFFTSISADAQIKSVYTNLDADKCKTLEFQADEGGVYKGECKGVGGHKLIVREGDLRQSIDVAAPGRKEHQLRLWEHFHGFSAVGPKAEWRMMGKKPVGLIFRFNVSEDVVDSSKITSYLIVAKITPQLACVTEIIKPSKTQNADARRAADRSANVPCKIAE
jgi:hypothetical protein